MIAVEFVGGPGRWAKVKSSRPSIVAVYSYRYDAALVPAMIENLTPMVDAFIGYDDRGATGLFSSEPARRAMLIDKAREIGADWVLAVDPDERFEAGFAKTIVELTQPMRPIAWSFRLREMYAPDAYRVDGVWGQKQVARLFPTPAPSDVGNVELHGFWFDKASGIEVQLAEVNIYHLKMITAERRDLRYRLYAHLDPQRTYQPVGYDYLVDDADLVLETIPPGRGYFPLHVDDGGTWMASDVPVPPLDPPRAVAGRMRANVRLGNWPKATALAHEIVRTSAADAVSRIAAAHVLDAAGETNAADHALSVISTGYDLAPQRAKWRRWFDGPAEIRRGRQVQAAELAVVVIALKGGEGLRAAVVSLLEQGPVEIVVVNSGGGAPELALAPHLDRLTLINIAEPLFAGAARNIGIDASTSPNVAFLAGDCIARPGWVEGRLRSHREGARGVASAMVAENAADDLCLAEYLMLFATRSPLYPAAGVPLHGFSYERRVFAEVGYFNPALRIGEDTEFAERLDEHIPVVWNRLVQTAHRGPLSIEAYLGELGRRGRRVARYRNDVLSHAADAADAHRELTTQRREMAVATGRLVLRLDEARLQRLTPLLDAGAGAYATGVQAGHRTLQWAAKAYAASAGADRVDRAIQLAERAARLDRQSVAPYLQLIDLLPDQDPRRSNCVRLAIWLSVFDETRRRKLAEWLSERDLVEAADELGRVAEFCAPLDAVLQAMIAELAGRLSDRTVYRNRVIAVARMDPAHKLADELPDLLAEAAVADAAGLAAQ